MSLLSLRHISKQFGALFALDDVSVDFNAGEVVALLGDNGAGKSTLIKVISGTYVAESGEILLAGEKVAFASPRDALDAGIQTLFQDLALCDNLDVVANLFLGRELRRSVLPGLSFFDTARMRRRASELLRDLAVDLPSVDCKVRDLSGGQRQSVAIARAVNADCRIIIMDEPTAALGVAQTRKVLGLVRQLRDRGMAVIYITHNLHDVMDVCDRCVVMKNGRKIGEASTAAVGKDELANMIITGEIKPSAPASLQVRV
ncbi:ATP-binding cassette domain-containing protein [Labrys wisconsinensis]|uniref:ABC-type sugar transport system ATPase subunit n=1 Tax=Labrys wisconsinensis TaxID=425677 RepID=A0ABU0J8K3_9HYPH|nr:ATP-binding cassette domain-containing protein [Labrys wisconsinensis]MDQ0470602.1 ABC-type sugar transport system ATPase subunit [Labrys wisconsinensis]